MRSFLRNRFKCLPWILCAREWPTFEMFSTATPTLPVQRGLMLERLPSPHCILFALPLTTPACSLCPNKDRKQTCDRNCPTSFRNTHRKHCTEPWRNDISNFFPLARSFHTVLTSSASSEPQSHKAFWAVASVARSCQHDVALCTSGERSVCNSELNQSSLVLTLCHINLRTTRAQFLRHRHV